MEHHIANLWRTYVYTMRMRVIHRKNGRPDVWPSWEGAVDLGNGAVSDKTPQTFDRPSLPAEFVAAFSRRTEAPEVRCDLTDTHRPRHDDYRNPRYACAPRVK